MLNAGQQTVKIYLGDTTNNSTYSVDADSLVILSQTDKKNAFQSLRYVTSTGQLTQIISKDQSSNINFTMIKKGEFLFLFCQKQQRMFRIINFGQKVKDQSLKFKWLKEKQVRVRNIFVFNQSNVIAIHLENIQGSAFTTVLFYSYDSFKKGTDPLAIWTYQKSICLNKVNNLGALGWEETESACIDYLKFHIIKFDKDKCLVKEEIITTINRLEECFCIESRIKQKQIYEIAEDQYLVHTENFEKEIQVALKKEQSLYANNFHIDTSKGPESAIIKKTKYPQRLEQFQGQLMTSSVSGLWLIFTFTPQPEMNILVKKVTVLLINFRSGQFMKEEHNMADTEKISVHPADWTPSVISTVITSRYTKSQTFKIGRYFYLKEHYLTFLLHLNQDFDDDLLQETIELLINDS